MNCCVSEIKKLNYFVCHFADDVAEAGRREAVETLTIGYNANTAHLYGGRREQYALWLGSKEALRAGFFAEEDDGVIRSPCGL